MEDTKKIKLETLHFNLFELAEGVYAAIEKENNTGSNAGIIDLGDCTVIFDTFLNIDAARELKRAAEQITGRMASYVINSHSHTDHFIGNCLFSERTAIVSTKPVRESIAKAKLEFESEKDQYAPRIKEIESSLKSGENLSNIQDLHNELLFLRNLVKRDVSIRVPNVTFEKEMMLHGSKRSLCLKAFDMAHSPGDVIAYLPDDKICFMGDLLSNRSHVWLGSGDPVGFTEVLEEILRYDLNDFVPGHGQLGSRADVLAQIQYINEILHLVRKKNSLNVGDYSIEDLSPMFRQWKSLCFSWNINFLVEKMKKEAEEQSAVVQKP